MEFAQKFTLIVKKKLHWSSFEIGATVISPHRRTKRGSGQLKSAVILAAGIGSRLSPITDEIPKCCVTINEESIIRRITHQLLSCDQNMNINIVVGHLSDKVRNEIEGQPDNVKIVENREYLITNNMESCRIGLGQNNVIEGDVLIINGDCVYSDSVVSSMHGLNHSAICIDSSHYSKESMKTLIEGTRAVAISKEILESQGGVSSIDIYNFTNSDLRNLYTIMERYFQQQVRDKWTEVAINDLLKKPNSNVRTLDIAGQKWIEIDDLDDLEIARKLW